MLIKNITTRKIVLASLFAALSIIGAKISIPIGPVPITMQTFFVYISALVLGGSLGALSQIIYVLIGILGPGMFATNPLITGGYLIGFIVGTYISGKASEANSRLTKVITKLLPKSKYITPIVFVLSLIICTIIIYFLGVIWLAGYLLNASSEIITFQTLIQKLPIAIGAGVTPFLIGDTMKIVIAIIVDQRTKKILKNILIQNQ